MFEPNTYNLSSFAINGFRNDNLTYRQRESAYETIRNQTRIDYNIGNVMKTSKNTFYVVSEAS